MNERTLVRQAVLVLLPAAVALLGLAALADAQSASPLQFLEKTRETARSGWSYLTTAAAFVVAGGSLAAGGRALFRGEWQHGAVGIGFGIAILMLMWALGGFFGFTTG